MLSRKRLYRRTALVVTLLLALTVPMTGLAHATTPPSPPFTQCPAVGLDTGCGILIVFNQDGTVSVLSDPSQPPYDDIEDTLIGVQNNTGGAIPSVQLSSASQPIFGFDGDGLCTQFPAPSGCPFGPTGYEGLNTSFTNIDTTTFMSGTVAFTGGLAPGASAYFSLEEAVDAASFSVTSIQLAPLSGTAQVGSSYTVSATVDINNAPATGAPVTFLVNSGPNAGKTGTSSTDSQGIATFSYASAVAGQDVITATAVTTNGVATSNAVTVTWTGSAPPPPACCSIAISGTSTWDTFISPLTATVGTAVFNESATQAEPAPGSSITVTGSLGFTVYDLRGNNQGWVAYLSCTGASLGSPCMTSSLAPSGNGAQIGASQFTVAGPGVVQTIPFFGQSFGPGVGLDATGGTLDMMQAVAGECPVEGIGQGIYNVSVPLNLTLSGLQVEYLTLPVSWTGNFDLTIIEGPASGGIPGTCS